MLVSKVITETTKIVFSQNVWVKFLLCKTFSKSHLFVGLNYGLEEAKNLIANDYSSMKE